MRETQSECHELILRLLANITLDPKPGVTADNIREAAKLLRVEIETK